MVITKKNWNTNVTEDDPKGIQFCRRNIHGGGSWMRNVLTYLFIVFMEVTGSYPSSTSREKEPLEKRLIIYQARVKGTSRGW